MAEYQLYCFGESGNAYKVALMMELCGADWKPRVVDFFNGETRSDEYRSEINEMGEVPVLVHGQRKLTQTGVMLEYLAGNFGKFGWNNDDERRDILRWMYFDNHKFTSYNATLRFMLTFLNSGETPVTEFLRGRADAAMQIVDKHLGTHEFMALDRLTIADFSLVGYMFYDGELGVDLNDYPNILKWRERISSLPGWKDPYDLMPRRAET